MRIPIPGGTKAGGGIGGILVIILFVVLTQCVGGGRAARRCRTTGLDTSRMQGADSGRYANCETGADANDERRLRPGRRRELPDRLLERGAARAVRHRSSGPTAVMQTFTGAVDTGCGRRRPRSGPFYCPPDEGIYLDTTFFEEVLQQQLGGPAGDFVEPYVLAHEYGHHIQNLLGTMGRVRTQQGPTATPYGWSSRPTATPACGPATPPATDDATGEPLIIELSEEDIQQAIAAAKSVGRRPDPGADHRPGQPGAVDPRLGASSGPAWFRPATPRAASRPATPSRRPPSSDL